MRRVLHHAAVVGVLTISSGLSAAPALSQTDIPLRIQAGSNDRFLVDSAGGIVALGALGNGTLSSSGNTSNGVRMMWYPFRGVFRAGSPGGTGSTSWDENNLGFYSWAGGFGTRATAFASFAFGNESEATTSYAVAIGEGTQVSGSHGFGAGYQVRCSGSSCHAGGYMANAAGTGAVALGYRTTADANYSVALGHRASTNGYQGAFVIADASTTDSLEAGAANQFSGRFAGGWRFYTNSDETAGVELLPGGSSFMVLSDRNRKENFTTLDGEVLLSKVRQIPVTRWQYIDEANRSTWHIGPMAQDWHAAFGLSDDPLTINMSDFDGVNLAAIRALEQRTATQAERIRALEAELAQRTARMEHDLSELRELVQQLTEQQTRD